jgi:Ca2+-binding RTX toxin-like protein
LASYSFQTITALEAAGYNGANDSLSFSAGSATTATVAYLTNPEQAAITFGGRTVNFGTGVYGDRDLTFSNGGTIYVGAASAENVTGSASDDFLYGGDGADILNGGDGNDALQGNQGADNLSGGAGDDSAYGGQGDDVIVLGAGRNWSNGNKGADSITGGDGVDTLLGGQDGDTVNGAGGDDFLNGNLGDDFLNGGAGNDTLLGEAGYDIMVGGGGADVFVFAAGSSEVSFPLADRILDWSSSYRIDLTVSGGYSEIASANPPPAGPPPTTPMPTDPYDYYYYNLGETPPDDVEPFIAATPEEFAGTLSAANAAMAANAALSIVATQSGADVAIYVDTDGNHSADLAIILTGTNLGVLDASNFI